ncbi:MAG: RluA family pseudouridine synthase [Myxococcales bacterium]|nr:RluA family pseudouridine synthase [Myxococcales bacterium]
MRVRLRPHAPPQRCDLAVVEALLAAGHACTRSQLARVFEAGGVTAAGRALRASLRIETPLEVDVVLPRPEPLRAEPEPLPLHVLHEDDDLLVVDKPAGMVVHTGPGHARGTLVNAVLHHLGVGPEGLPVLAGNDATRPGIVHRLDRDTSGVLVIAKHAAAQEALAAQFRRHALHRRYLSVVEGAPSWDAHAIETGHARDPTDRRRFAPVDGATRRARSEIAVERRLRGAAVLAWTLHTGRTHQIRMHARHLGLPILGDALYGRTPRDAVVREAVRGLARHALHAERLELRHPRDGAWVCWSSPLPPELVALVEALAREA